MPSAFPSALLGSGRPITLRGAGHSCDGQTVTDGELLVTYAPAAAAAQVRDLGAGLVEVPAGMSWYGLERYLNRRGRAVPVLPNYLHMSVGGTLSVGGAGVTSVRYGMQIDHVERIQLTDGTGASRWCSRTENPELFRFALGGLGMVGLIERAVLRTIPYHRYCHVHRTRHGTLTELVEHTESIAQREDIGLHSAFLRRGEFGSVTGWVGADGDRCDNQDCAVVADLPLRGQRWAPSELSSGHARLWTDYVVPAERFAQMVAAVEPLLHRAASDRIRTELYVLIVRRAPEAGSFAFAPIDKAPISLGLGVYTWLRRDQAPPIRRMFGDLMDRCCELGGRPYLYGVHDLDRTLAEQLYATDLDRLAQLRSAHRLEHINAHLPLARAAVSCSNSGQVHAADSGML
ncbi:FAD-binding oxidoreductase [Nocardia beijingensis]|uniref:FAD-binding oxidoreductase n=1 Tax=Nocardia beijingensis TaxID=95162 RepID=UPI001893D0BF|nr:FAD-binding oxidoreductase [Nocardia beijingensis]MBF6468882.1 FAD-binding oxidoreductase [Nocardia beijingensis]